MTTTIQPHPSPSPKHPRWEAIKRSFTQSNYITDFWNWLMSKAAELVLFGSVLYSGYQLLPNITHAPAQVDAVVFVIQQAALDIGGMGLLKLAKRAGLPKDAFPMRVGVILVVLMILNVVLASLKQTVPLIPPGVFIGIETILLIARAIMAVLFGYAIHALREEYGESTITLKEAGALQQRMIELSEELSERLTESEQRVTEQYTELLRRTATSLSVHFTEQVERTVSEQPTRSELTNITDMVQAHAHTLTELTALKSVIEQLQREVRPLLDAHTEQRPPFSVSTNARPKLSVVEPNTEHRMANAAPKDHIPKENRNESDKGAFIRRCLSETPNIRNAEIQRKASEQGISISPAYISETRHAFLREQTA